MAYTFITKRGITYILHARSVPGKDEERMLYYFSPVRKDNALPALPDKMQIVETRTGLPLVRCVEETQIPISMETPIRRLVLSG